MNSMLRQFGLAAVLATLGFLSPALGAEPAKSDQELLQGTWECTATIKDGQKVQTYVGVRAVIEGDNLTWYYPKNDGTYNTEKCKFRIDAAKKHFDWWRPAKPESVEVRLYSVTETELRMSTNLDYKTRPAAINQGKWQFVCRRVQN